MGKLLNLETKFWNSVGAGLQPVLRLADDTGVLGRVPIPAPVLPCPHQPMPASSIAKVDEILNVLDAHKAAWVQMGTRERTQLLEAALRNAVDLAPRLARVGTLAKGSYEGGDGEDMATVLPLVNGLLEYRESMQHQGAAPPLRLYQRLDGQWVAHVWPRKMIPAFFPNFVAEVWIEPGQQPSQGALYRRKQQQQDAGDVTDDGGVCLVLGAGNQLPVVALDILHALFAEDKVVLVKMNPVNDYYGPILRQVFAPFVAAGVLDFVYGGADVGAYCTNHRAVSTIHLTGSDVTYNNIVFGSPTVKPGMQPVLRKPVTAELGNVTPYIVVPGPWSQRDIEFHATNVVSGLAQNTGHNCVAAEILITDASWPQRPAFLAALSRCLDTMYRRAPWYPGSAARLAAFKKRFPQAQELGREEPEAGQTEGHVKAEPWMLVTGLGPDEAQTRHENWGGVLQEVALPGCSDPGQFLAAAVEYANTRCWGTLSASIFIHPKTQKQFPSEYDAAVAGLKYGTVSVNCPATAAFCTTAIVWGAFPGNPPDAIGSGCGFVHNTYMFDHPQKGVMIAPWTYSPQPLWSMGQLGLTAALPWAFKYMMAQSNPPKALAYLIMVAILALRHSWRPADKNARR